ncbi:MAG: glycoside hydrolase family 3 N-terminal domain-containing protein [Pseudomonadota bacterium]|nr:glycoside hydrolase family 3 N-terminal domain-containing protein [Pseudomonadota bacterium]
MGGLILTPGIECTTSSTEHYSVYVAKSNDQNSECPETEALFASPYVCGALFFQHHMMAYDKTQGKMVAQAHADIKKTVEKVRAVNQGRMSKGIEPISCMFDAEPEPVAGRRYFSNPRHWPEETAERIKQISMWLKQDKVDEFLHREIDTKKCYPLLPSNQSVGELAQIDRSLAIDISEIIGLITGRVMGSLGINVLYAPVCDLQAEAFAERCYGKEADIVVDLATSWARGALSQRGIDQICLKHAPGHGVKINQGKSDQQDTHNAKCQTDASIENIEKHMKVFTEVVNRLLGYGVPKSAINVMTNHIRYLEIDSNDVVSCSQKSMQFIRDRLPSGIGCVADCINMASYGGSQEGFVDQLEKTLSLHDAGVIATTHYVKRMTRRELIQACESFHG